MVAACNAAHLKNLEYLTQLLYMNQSEKLFAATEEKVVSLFSGKQSPGRHTHNWNSAGISSGIYFYKLTVYNSYQDQYQIFKKMALIK